MSRSLWAFTHYLKKALLALCSLKRQGDQHWISLLLVKASPTSCSPARQVPVRIQPWLLLLHILRVQSLGSNLGLALLMFPIRFSPDSPYSRHGDSLHTAMLYLLRSLSPSWSLPRKNPLILQGQLRPSLLYKAFFDNFSLYQRCWVSSH